MRSRRRTVRRYRSGLERVSGRPAVETDERAEAADPDVGVGESVPSAAYDRAVRREFSAGGVVVRRLRRGWHVAAIRPGGKTNVWALPKGLVAPGEDPASTALREVAEETGVVGRLVTKLGDVRYVYTWRGERVFKVVSFYLVRYARGRLGDLPAALAHEIAEARWLPLAEAPSALTYKGEKEMAEKALELLARNEL
jgi:8-oxo-dGTP pyrophosphatase MutT (NUDIX family)